MSASTISEGVIRGLNRGRKLKKVTKPAKVERPQGVIMKAKHAIKAVIHDVVGFLPFERRAQEFLKIGREKKALKYCKKRIGSHHYGKKKRDQLAESLRQKKK
ncbi:60S Ribosomal protein L36 [Perkinsela sp. CCAP 1560/4]|nr:60S Ribosomal protein L36 [Perkinsela sp. CCAP 1560/4]|eukprot:KNH09232.1 60S Ribosomal protein L36 [Perkinsela sp. CCAP 1560/4]